MAVRTAAQLRAGMNRKLLSLGFSAAFAAEKTAALSPLFLALEKTDAGRLLCSPADEAARDAFVASVSPPLRLPDATAYQLALSLLTDAEIPAVAEEAPAPPEAADPGAGRNDAPEPPEAQEPPEERAPGAPLLRTPTPQRVRAALDRLKKEKSYAETEERRKALFEPQPEEDERLLSARLAFAGALYGRCPQDPDAAARRLSGLQVSAPARLGSQELIPVLAARLDPRMRADTLRWVVRLCACYAPAYYPVSCERANAALRYLRDEAGFYPFLERDLQDYAQYKKVLLLFRRSYGLQRFSLPELALYLEAEGNKLKEIEK